MKKLSPTPKNQTAKRRLLKHLSQVAFLEKASVQKLELGTQQVLMGFASFMASQPKNSYFKEI